MTRPEGPERRHDAEVLAVLVSRLEAITVDLRGALIRIDALDAVYVRKGEYGIQHEADKGLMTELRTDFDGLVDRQRRTLAIAIGSGLLPLLVGLLLLVFQAVLK
jgi:hypothetical protein